MVTFPLKSPLLVSIAGRPSGDGVNKQKEDSLSALSPNIGILGYMIVFGSTWMNA